jgi:hypothetical protein
VVNDYLYVSNPLLKSVRISAFFESDVPNEILYPECDCGGLEPTVEDLCTNPLDKQYGLPGYLEKQVLELVSQKLLSTYFKIKTDLTEDGVDGQASNAPNGK